MALGLSFLNRYAAASVGVERSPVGYVVLGVEFSTPGAEAADLEEDMMIAHGVVLEIDSPTLRQRGLLYAKTG